MHYRKATKEEISLRTIDKYYFLGGISAFFVVLLSVGQIKHINRYLPAILLGTTGIIAEIFAAKIIVMNRRDKEDGLVKGFNLVPTLAYICLSIVTFLLLLVILLLFAASIKREKL